MIYQRLLVSGRSWEQIDEMCLADVELLFDYWREHPPAEDLIAAYLGYKTPASAGKSVETGPPAEIIQMREFAALHLKSGGKLREVGAL